MANDFRLCNTHNHDPSNQTAQSSSNSLFNFNVPSHRRGFDLRRPIMSQPRQDIIDLTDDTSSPPETHIIPPGPSRTETSATANRPPRFERNIINVDEQETSAVETREESPEIQFLTSRTRSRSLSSSRRLDRRRPGFVSTVRSPGHRSQIPVRATAGDRNPHQISPWADVLHGIHFPRPQHLNLGRVPGDELIGVEGDFGVAEGLFQVPGNLNFLQAGFDYEQPSRPQPQQPRLPTYDPPPPTQHGFTRSPDEDDVLACPHCDDELGVGDNEVKRQVWIVKACGHVRARFLSLLQWLTDISGLLWRVCD